jgi:hypothetical protein
MSVPQMISHEYEVDDMEEEEEDEEGKEEEGKISKA